MSGHVNRIFLLLLLLAQACASVTPPSGGPQDQTPPALVSAFPEPKTLNFSSQKIILEFDEQVELRDLQKELLITPYTENTYKSKADKKTITLEFEKPLEENTTYTLNFRKSIRDLTEGNIAEFPPLTFSTGHFLDSGTVTGKVVKILTQKPEAETDVLLYRAADTGSVKTTKPFYVTRTDASGNYQFSNVATGAYRIFALSDKNNSLTYDQDIERIGFLTDTIHITAKRPPVNLTTTRIDTRKPYITRRTPQADKAEIEYNEGIKSITLTNLTGTDSLIYITDESGKNLQIFRKPDQKDLRFIATATDSMGFVSTDTVSLTFIKPYKQEQAQLIAKNNSGLYLATEPFQLQASHPVKQIEPGAFTLLADSVPIATIDSDKILLLQNGQLLQFPSFQLPKKLEAFTLTADTTKLITASGHIFQSYTQQLSPATGSTTGSLRGTVTTSEPNYLLQLLDNNFEIIRTQVNGPSFSFSNLPPSTYKLRLIADRNNNAKWDNASPDLKTLPEPVFIHPDELVVRANWELEDIVFDTTKPVDNKPKRK